ncbi:NAD(P)-dependent oxidoreductase [Celeribacter neptunius]|uniref:3-hydroxyisobutyrate dehydrogenase n=1 Tax=Celeribacter neptunius TaxID=588602 RepID=A0A1I3TQW0_9RHOB|nr:NAD(P)-dependent oxidoreductase [Celeribacter neptunius]SFJ72026.1 3-hydroxyisobutyrate dehydrogenase [Celeribacter neptunius]
MHNTEQAKMGLTTIGLAGVGRMGRGMLANMLKAGIEVAGFDIRPESDFPGLPVTSDADRFAERLETLFTVVRDADQTDEVLFGTQGFVTRAKKLKTVVICSTLSPNYVRELRARVPDHIALVDAPMSGAQVGAREATLAFMIGGAETDVAALIPMFQAMGTNIHHMGGFGDGMQSKVLNNLLCSSHTAMARLVLDWADKTGVDRQKLLNLIETATGQNWFTSRFDQIEFSRHGFEPDNTIGILVKDVTCALDAAPEGADTSLPEVVREAMRDLKPIA